MLCAIGMWLERYLIIVPLSEPASLCAGCLHASWVEWSMLAGLSAGFVLALVLFSKFFPIISIWEMEKEDREKEKMN